MHWYQFVWWFLEGIVFLACWPFMKLWAWLTGREMD
jgi:hypothetical protein